MGASNVELEHLAGLDSGEKIRKYGSMYEYYYPLDVTIFMNEKDRDITESLWTKYWKSSII
jgi:hypothetical protein